MKTFIIQFTTILFFTIFSNAGVNGAGGGSTIDTTSGQLATIEVCGRGDSGSTCEKVSYKIRPASHTAATVATCMNGETEVACPAVYGVPTWLQELNHLFKASAPAETTGPTGQ